VIEGVGRDGASILCHYVGKRERRERERERRNFKQNFYLQYFKQVHISILRLLL